MENRTEAAKLLLEKGADSQVKDNVGCKAIDYATSNGLRDIITLLLKNENNDNKNNSGNTPLHQLVITIKVK